MQHYYYNCMVAPKSRNVYVKFDMHVKHKVGKFHQIIKSHNTASSGSISHLKSHHNQLFHTFTPCMLPLHCNSYELWQLFGTLSTIICEGLAFYLLNSFSHVSSTLLYSGGSNKHHFQALPKAMAL